MRKNGGKALIALASLAVAAPLARPHAQGTPAASGEAAWTAADDHAQMLAQLGTRSLRPGPTADASAPNAANYDEAKANPYPVLPDALTLKNEAKVASPATWWNERRPQIVEDFEREVVGRVLAQTPAVAWSVVATREWLVAGKRVVGRQLVGTVDNSAYRALDVAICMTLVTPVEAERVPVMIMFGGGALPAEAITPDALPETCRPPAHPSAPPAVPAAGTDPPETDQLIAAGWGYASRRTSRTCRSRACAAWAWPRAT